MDRGKVFLVGAGPGDPKLLTLKAFELLKKAEVVVYDRLVSEAILKLIPDDAERIYVGKSSKKHELTQDKITALLVEKGLEGKRVVRLKGGDPFLFGRGGEEAEALVEHGVDFEVVPGVTSAIAAPAYAGIPLTHRDYASSVAVVTGHMAENAERQVNWAAIAGAVDTIVVLMGVGELESTAKKLVEGGLNPDTPVALVECGTLKHQRSVTGKIGTIAEEARKKNVTPPAVIVIGEVATLGGKLGWFQKTSTLKGKTVAITRPRGQAEEAAEMITRRGGTPYLIPAIEIKGASDLKPIKKFISELHKEEVDLIIFMSVNGVRHLLSAAESLGILAEALDGLRKTVMLAIGPRTARELESHQIKVDIVPSKYTSEGVMERLEQLDVSGKKVRIPRTSSATPVLKEKLWEMDALVQEVYVYESAVPEDKKLGEKFFQDLTNGNIDAIVFGSTSCVKNLFHMLEDQISQEKLSDLMNSKVTVVAIGPVTAEALAEMGVEVDVMPEVHLFEEALDALAFYWNSSQ
jgi:uroporphyrinogen III methyltransferase/synthase